MVRSLPTVRVASVAVAALVLLAPPGAAQEDPLEAERDRVARQRTQVAGDLDVLRAEDSEIEAALASTANALELQRQAAAAAAAEVVVAEARATEARRVAAGVRREIRDLERQLRELAVQAYMRSGTDDPLGAVLSASDMNEAAERLTVVDVVAVDTTTVIEQLESARRRLDRRQADSERAASAAEQRRRAAEAEATRLTALRAEQERLATEVATRIESRLAEAAVLAQYDADLAETIEARQAALAALAEQARVVRPPVPSPVPAPPPEFTAPVIPLRTVRGITVHEDIADELEAMLAAAEVDGIVLGGGGYRSPAAQWQLRVQNCPDPVSSPASACSPPTARPGQSLHERGLAVDFTVDDQIIAEQSHPAFVWLAEHAAAFGFYNLPSEPWHWSIDGS